MSDNPYMEFSTAELRQELDRRGKQGSKATSKKKEELAALLLESDGENDSGEATATVYSIPYEYDPTEEERLRDKLVGYQIALRAVEGQKQVSGGQPIYNDTIQELNEKVTQLKAELGL